MCVGGKGEEGRGRGWGLECYENNAREWQGNTSTSMVPFSKAQGDPLIYLRQLVYKSHLLYCNVIIQPVTHQSAVYIIIIIPIDVYLHNVYIETALARYIEEFSGTRLQQLTTS